MNESTKKRILLADNSREYRRSVRGFLELEGYLVDEAANPKEARDKLQRARFDLLLVEVRLQEENDSNDASGLEIAKEASDYEIPTIIVTAFPTVELARIELRSLSLEPSLASDFITKASGPQALLDSIRRILKNIDNKLNSPAPRGLIIDTERRVVWKDGRLINLSKNQYILLETLFKKEGTITYAELIRAIFDEDVSDKVAFYDKRLRNLVDRTKNKLGETDSNHEHLESIPGLGFKLNLSFAGDPTTDAPPPLKKKKRKGK